MRRQIVSVALATGIVQLASLLKLWLIARYFGVSAELDGYNLAFVLPTLLAGILSGALQTGLFPVYAELRIRRDQRSIGVFEARIFWSLLSLGMALAFALYVFADLIAWQLSKEAGEAVVTATAFVLRWSAFALPLSLMGDYLGYLLALRGRYLVAAAAPAANALVGAALLASWPEGGLLNLAAGTLLGASVQVAMVYRAVRVMDFSPLRAMARVVSLKPANTEMLKLAMWVLPGVLFANLANAIPPVLIASFGEGAVSAFGYAIRLHQSAVQLFVMAASPIILARFSQLAAEGDRLGVDRLQRKGMVLGVLLGVLALVLVGAFGEALLRFVMGYGRFDASAASRVALHWFYLTLGFGFAVYGNVLAKRVQAEKGAKLLAVFALTGLVALWLCWWLARDSLGQYSVPLAISAAMMTTCVAMTWFFHHRTRTRVRRETVKAKVKTPVGNTPT